MNKKITSLIVLCVFISFTCSCATRMVNLAKGESWDTSSRILTVFTKSGDLINFAGQKPGKMKQGEIVGTAVEKTGIEKRITIPLSEVEVLWVKSGSKKILLLPLAAFGIYFSYKFIYWAKNA